MKKRKRFGGRKRWRRTISRWDFAQAQGHRSVTGKNTCSSVCGIMAEHKWRMKLRADEHRGGRKHIGSRISYPHPLPFRETKR